MNISHLFKIYFKPLLKNKQTLLLFLTALFFVFVLYLAENLIFSIHFVDEDDTFAVGKMLFQGYKVYGDIFSHHQPFEYFFSAIIQLISRPHNILLLVKRHREFIMIWSFVWAIILVHKWKTPLFFSIILIELSKPYLLGNLFLSESLVIYPLLYLLCVLFYEHNINDKEVIVMTAIFITLGLFLAPLWPALLVLFIAFALKVRKWNRYKLLLMVLILSLFCFAVMPFISFKDYLFNTFVVNLKYYAPTRDGGVSFFLLVKSFTTFITSYLSRQSNPILNNIRTAFFFLFVSYGFLIRKKQFRIILFSFLMLGILNMRYVEPGSDYYGGFHLLPWYAALIFFTISCLHMSFISKRNMKQVFGITILFIILIFGFNSINLFKIRDRSNDFYIHFSSEISIAETIKGIKKSEDTLFISPIDPLIYWGSEIKPASKYLFYYKWMSEVPFIQREVKLLFFRDNKPVFVYYNHEDKLLDTFLSSYIEIESYHNASHLYMLKNRFIQLTNSQKKEFNITN